MTTGTVMKENGVLKLVHPHPGRYVEIHTDPITAREVMEKNPRHCVARPDFFKFPWIVVRPESVLELGKVFYIVPNHTVHVMLKAYNSQKRHSLPKTHSSKSHDHHQYIKQAPVAESGAKVTPMYKDHDPCLLEQHCSVGSRKTHKDRHKHRLKQQSPVMSRAEETYKQQELYRHLKQPSSIRSEIKVTPEGQDQDQCPKQQSQIESQSQKAPKHKRVTLEHQDPDQCLEQFPVKWWGEETLDLQDHHLEFKLESLDDHWIELRPFRGFDDADGAAMLTEKDRLKIDSCHQVTRLKSCLREHGDNSRKLRGLRVTFSLPGEGYKEEIRQVSTKCTGY